MIQFFLLAGGVTFAQAWHASEINEKSQDTIRKAYQKQADATALFNQHRDKADRSLVKLANRKRAILSVRMPRFLDTYQQIRAIDFRPGEGIVELYTNSLVIKNEVTFRSLAVTALQPMSDKEIFTTYLISGLGGLMLADSRRAEVMASKQNRIANLHQSQTRTMIVAIDAIGAHAEQIANLLSKLSVLFADCIDSTEKIIARNGANRSRYTASDKAVLMNCVNLASAIKSILDVPVLTKSGEITDVSMTALAEGELRLTALKSAIGG